MKYEKSCGCIIIDDNKVLLIQQNEGHWGFPKGHVEGNETEKETAIREVKEETNLDVEINDKHKYFEEYSPEEGIWKKVVYFVATKLSDKIIPQKEEVQNIEWIDVNDAIEKLTFENSKKILKKVIEDFNL